MSNSLVIVGRFSKCSFYILLPGRSLARHLPCQWCLAQQSPRDRWTSECLKRRLTQLAQQSLTAALLECELMTFDDPIDPCWSLSQTLGIRLVFQYISASRVDAWLLLALRQAADAQGLGLQLSCIPWSKFRFHRETNHKTYNILQPSEGHDLAVVFKIRIEKSRCECRTSVKVLQSLTRLVVQKCPETSCWTGSSRTRIQLRCPSQHVAGDAERPVWQHKLHHSCLQREWLRTSGWRTSRRFGFAQLCSSRRMSDVWDWSALWIANGNGSVKITDT